DRRSETEIFACAGAIDVVFARSDAGREASFADSGKQRQDRRRADRGVFEDLTDAMRNDFKIERRLIMLGLLLLVAADVAFAVWGYNLSAGRQPQDELAVLTRNRDLLRADIARAQDIRKRIPAIKQDCDKFEESLYPSSKGYSSVSAELDSIAAKAGLIIDSTGFRQSEIKGREMEQVEIDAVVD